MSEAQTDDDGLTEEQRQQVLEIACNLIAHKDRRALTMTAFDHGPRQVIHMLLRIFEAVLDGVRTPEQAREFTEMNADLMDIKWMIGRGSE